MDAPRRFITARELVELYPIFNEPTLRSWRHRGAGPPYVKLERLVVYDLGDVEAWIEARRRGPQVAA